MTDPFFEKVVQPLSAISLTENGAVTHKSTLSACLDLLNNVLPETTREKLESMLAAAWGENSLACLRLIFQLRDIRHGKGIEENFYRALDWLRLGHPDTFYGNIQHVPQHGCFKDLLKLVLLATSSLVGSTEAPGPTPKQLKAAAKSAASPEYLRLEILSRSSLQTRSGRIWRGWTKAFR